MKDKQQSVPNILKRLAHLFETPIKAHKLVIPEKYGSGYCTGFVFNEDIRMFIFHYELNENIVIENPYVDDATNWLLFKFQNVIPVSTNKQSKTTPSVLIATSSLNSEKVIPIHSNIATINIEVDANYLKGLFDLPESSTVLQGLLQNTQPLLFDQMINASLQKIIDELVSGSIEETFKLFYLRVKAEELICRLLMELEKRDETQLYDLNPQDVQTIYRVKAQMLKHLSTPPVINELAVSANMSPTKLKRLFRQIFGNSIFSYYQEFRMKEAARLLREEKLSVSDVDYQLGFSNLSHFTRVFKEHTGVNPKQYSRLP